jgi:anti-anti-sigma factor
MTPRPVSHDQSSLVEAQPFALTSVAANGVGHIRLTGEFDAEGAASFDRRVDAMGELRHLYVDLRDVTFVDSMAVRSLVRCYELLDGAITLDRPSEQVRRLLHLVGLEPIFHITGPDEH